MTALSPASSAIIEENPVARHSFMIFFSHVPRTAGSTIHSYFSKPFDGLEQVQSGHYGPGSRWLVVSSAEELPAVAEVIRYLPDRHYYLGGHVGLHELAAAGIGIEPDDIVIAMTRNPVERAISLYYLALRSPDWLPFLPPEATSNGFAHFYAYCRTSGVFFHNDHCRTLSGTQSFEETLRVLEADFNLVSSQSAMGAFERALTRLCAPLISGFEIDPKRENAAFHHRTENGEWRPKDFVKELAGPELIAKIESDNGEDIRLVDFVERIHNGVFENQPTRRRGESLYSSDARSTAISSVGARFGE